MVTELRGRLKEAKELRLKLGEGKMPEDALVFGRLDGTPLHPDLVSAQWAASVTRLKLPRVTLHALRHTHVSQLIAAGVDVLTISRRIGHASPAITLSVYGHLFTNTDDRAAAVIEAAYQGGGKTE